MQEDKGFKCNADASKTTQNVAWHRKKFLHHKKPFLFVRINNNLTSAVWRLDPVFHDSIIYSIQISMNLNDQVGKTQWGLAMTLGCLDRWCARSVCFSLLVINNSGCYKFAWNYLWSLKYKLNNFGFAF